ncbi:serine aminopeptidase domain-containing protein [Demequina litorisediminis]|uniref:serine aminopeptidase domain-containing protein n=1 Tax=Demequina litorisediminis TaxID=1849022 RepID=UPI0024E15B17|nr:alpha/beta hydrolase [Demequina litorisediminis]
MTATRRVPRIGSDHEHADVGPRPPRRLRGGRPRRAGRGARSGRWAADQDTRAPHRRAGAGAGVALIVHGYNDYFFATHLADAMAQSGCAVYAVDMRRAGRSLRDGNQAHHIGHIDELGEDIAHAAAAAVADAAARGLGSLPLVVHAHSTGAWPPRSGRTTAPTRPLPV